MWNSGKIKGGEEESRGTSVALVRSTWTAYQLIELVAMSTVGNTASSRAIRAPDKQLR